MDLIHHKNLPMQVDFLENVILMSVKKHRNNYITVLHNVPKNKMKEILSACKTKFGCGGSVSLDNGKEAIILQGDHKHTIETVKNTIFNGFEIRNGESK